MKNIKFTDNQIKAIYNLYIYGFREDEISDMINGMRIYDIINTKTEKILDSILDYTEDENLYYSNHICNHVNMEAILQDSDNCKKIIDSLKELQENVKQDIDSTMSEVFVEKIDEIIKIINNIEKIQYEYNTLTQELAGGTNNTKTKEILRSATYTATLKEDAIKQIKVEPIITKEQWKELEEAVKEKN